MSPTQGQRGERTAADDSRSITLVVETELGTFVRRIQPASELPLDDDLGSAAEAATRSAAAIFGLPDFVFRPEQRRTASGSRELGDVIVAVGEVAAAVQVKARGTAPSEEAREEAWLQKRIKKAIRQAHGTIRAMTSAPVTLINERGRQVRIDGPSLRWVPTVIVDHPNPPAGHVPALLKDRPAIVILRRDWEFLFEQLKATDAVIRYLHRVLDLPAVALGEEPLRYYQLAQADADAEPSPPDPRLAGPGMKLATTPVLPRAPAGLDDRQLHSLLRILLEDLATAPRPPGFDEGDMLGVLAAVDTLPVGLRTSLGGTLIDWLRQVSSHPVGETLWRFRRIAYPERPNLIFAAATRWDEAVNRAFSMLVELRHQQYIEATGEDATMTAGVLLTPRGDGRRPWDTTLAATRGDLGLGAEYRALLEQLWPISPSPD